MPAGYPPARTGRRERPGGCNHAPWTPNIALHPNPVFGAADDAPYYPKFESENKRESERFAASVDSVIIGELACYTEMEEARSARSKTVRLVEDASEPVNNAHLLLAIG